MDSSLPPGLPSPARTRTGLLVLIRVSILLLYRTARSELRKVLFFGSVTFLFVYEIYREPLNA